MNLGLLVSISCKVDLDIGQILENLGLSMKIFYLYIEFHYFTRHTFIFLHPRFRHG